MLSATLLILAMAPGVTDTIFQSDFDGTETCPEGRQVLANIVFGQNCGAETVDVTEWSNIWGRDCGSGEPVPFPGITGLPSGDPTISNFGRTTYIAAHFHAGDDLPDMFGWITHAEYDYGADLTASFSQNCGDFNPANPVCVTAAVSGQQLAPWRIGGGNFCPLVRGQDYYFNVKLTNPGQGTATCSAESPTCAVSLTNNVSTP